MDKSKKIFMSALFGAILIAICCFTPVLVIMFVVVGLSILVPYLDLVLFPALGILIIITVVSFKKWKMTNE